MTPEQHNPQADSWKRACTPRPKQTGRNARAFLKLNLYTLTPFHPSREARKTRELQYKLINRMHYDSNDIAGLIKVAIECTAIYKLTR